jgi:hypothetical protein
MHYALQSASCNVLSFGWDGGTIGCNGAIWISELCGYYFYHSSDFSPLGPTSNLEDLLEIEEIRPVPNPELFSDILPHETLLKLGRRVVDIPNEGEVFINDKRYTLEDLGVE